MQFYFKNIFNAMWNKSANWLLLKNSYKLSPLVTFKYVIFETSSLFFHPNQNHFFPYDLLSLFSLLSIFLGFIINSIIFETHDAPKPLNLLMSFLPITIEKFTVSLLICNYLHIILDFLVFCCFHCIRFFYSLIIFTGSKFWYVLLL